MTEAYFESKHLGFPADLRPHDDRMTMFFGGRGFFSTNLNATAGQRGFRTVCVDIFDGYFQRQERDFLQQFETTRSRGLCDRVALLNVSGVDFTRSRRAARFFGFECRGFRVGYFLLDDRVSQMCSTPNFRRGVTDFDSGLLRIGFRPLSDADFN